MAKLIIEAGRGERQYWRDLWRYRELFAFLAWRDLLIRYKQTAVGVAWAVLRPFLTMLVLTLVMKVTKLEGDKVSPIPLFVFCAMLPWQFFSTALSESGTSLITNSNLISKVYFPRLVVPASSVITSFVDFLIAGAFMVFLMLVYWLMALYRFPPPGHLLALPIFMLLTFGASFGVGLWIAALMVKYRDFRFVVPFIVQFGLYAAPVFAMTANIPDRLPATLPEKWHWLQWVSPALLDWVNPRLIYSLNPVVGIIDGFRWCLLGGPNALYWPGQAASLAGVAVLIFTGLWYFRKTERSFADII
ncbi:MAG: ABC transporter permease [Verrucomicrobiota bacterium]|jgi:lipopolysaccharide transport system permease protein